MTDNPPEAPPADHKDWTWVLNEVCPECGFDVQSIERDQLTSELRQNTKQWSEILKGDDLRSRPSADVWSPTEYACHVRDVHRLYLQRLGLMLEEDNPLFADWDQNVTAVETRYDLAEPAQVATELVQAGDALADALDDVADHQWDRPGRRSDGADFTIETFARYFLHDPVHHLHDVTK